MAQTVYAKCVQAGKPFEHQPWVLWINVKASDREQFPVMVLRKWLRERGGVAPGERLSVTVYTYDDSTPLHRNGLPRRCHAVEFAVN